MTPDGPSSRPPVRRRAVLAAAAAGLAGCAGSREARPSPTATANPAAGDAEQFGDLALTSPAFEDGGPIPREHGRHAADVNPPLRIAGVPGDAAGLVLVMDDPDAVEPAGQVWLHWLVWDIDPSTTAIPEGWAAPGAVVGENDFGERGYGGPAPPDGVHTYRFKLYAVGAELGLHASATKAEVGAAMAGHVLARTQLEGTYGP